tara:strand:+ start:850 stop:1089 length:240 start_codon:yes stop_codon:yes gene_type:complete
MPEDYGSYKLLSAIRDVQLTVERIKSNDLAHINSRLNKVDIRLASMSTNIKWLTWLAGILTTAIVAGIVGVALEIMEII